MSHFHSHEVTTCHSRHSTATHCGGPAHSTCFTAAYCVALHCLQCLPAAQWDGFVSSQFSHYHSLSWLCVVPFVLLLLPSMALCCSRYLTAVHMGGYALTQVSHSCFLGWLCIVPGVTLPFTEVVLCCLRCFTATH